MRRRGPFRSPDVPDVYLKLQYANNPVWKTSVVPNNIAPEWNESKTYQYADQDTLVLSGWDKNKGKLDKDDYYGQTKASIKNMLLAGGKQEVELMDGDDKPTGLFITLKCSLAEE